MARMRWGALTAEDITALNSRVGARVVVTSNTHYFKPVVVGTNELRCAVNLRSLLESARTGLVQLYECVAVVPSSAQKNLCKFRNFDDHRTGRIPLKLVYFFRMPIMITKRVADPAYKTVFANGTIGHIVAHHLAEDTYLQRTVEVVAIRRHRTTPEALSFGSRIAKPYFKTDTRLACLHCPLHETESRSRYLAPTTARQTEAPRPHDDGSSFPVVPAFACTPKKLQGQTCHDGVVVATLDRGGRPGSAEGRYVAFSRTISLDKLTLTQPISHLDVSHYTPKRPLVAEIRRLLSLVVLPPYAPSHVATTLRGWLASQSNL